jgi:hypothetical protein
MTTAEAAAAWVDTWTEAHGDLGIAIRPEASR